MTLLLCACILAWWWSNAAQRLGGAPMVVSLDRVEVTLAPGQRITLGAPELLQTGGGAAEDTHIELSHVSGGRVLMRNVARQKRLWLEQAVAGGTYAARWRLQPGDGVAGAAFSLSVLEASPGKATLMLRHGGREHQLDVATGAAGADVALDGQPLADCLAPTLMDRLRSLIINRLARDDRGESRVLTLGGLLTCRTRNDHSVAVKGIPFRAFSLVTRSGELYFAPGENVVGVRPAVQFRRGQEVTNDFGDIAWDIDPPGPEALKHIIAGRTRYRVELAEVGTSRRVTLLPVSKLHRLSQVQSAMLLAQQRNPAIRVVATAPRLPFSEAEMPDPLADLNGAERALRLGLVIAAVGLAFLAAAWRVRAARGWARVGAVAPALAGLVCVGAAAALALAPDLARAMGLSLGYREALAATLAAYGLASLLVGLSPGLTFPARIAWLAFMGLVAMGNLTLTSLALDAPRTDFAIHVHKNKLMFVDLVPLVVVLLSTLPAGMAAAWPRSFFAGGRTLDAWGRFVPAGLLTTGLVVWWLVGTETGVAGFQPVELGKIALVLILAHVFAGFMRLSTFYGQRQYLIWLAAQTASVVVFLVLLTSVPFLKSDYSPILIIIATATALAFAFLGPAVLLRLGEVWRILRNRRAAPQGRPRLGWPRGTVLAGVLLLLLLANLALLAAFPALASRVITGQWRMPADRLEAMDQLETARAGPLRVPAERLLTWYDLHHGVVDGTRAGLEPDKGAAAKGAPDVLHRDLGLQLLLSKLALAQTPCALTTLTLLPENSIGRAMRAYLATHNISNPEAALCAALPVWPSTAVPEQAEVNATAATAFTVDDLLRVPVIQNDFIATYLLVRFGLPAGLAVLALQLLFVMSSLALAIGLRWRRAVGFQDEGARTGLSIAVAGVGVLFALHWTIAWANAIGLLPVMGQPMTLIAAATSHHLLMALPALALVLLAGRQQALRTIEVNRAPPRW
jgi:cell division protein FtsW (lipid II flippase)